MGESMDKIEVPVNMKERVLVPKGLYQAKISRLDTKPVPTSDGGMTDYLHVYFQIHDNSRKELNGLEIDHSIPLRVSRNSGLAALLQSAGVNLEGKTSTDVSVLVGKEAELTVIVEKKQTKAGKEIDVNKVVDVDFKGVAPRK
jgi:hypothetical protein